MTPTPASTARTRSYHANDGTENSNEAAVDVTVDPVNDVPQAVDDDATTDEGVALPAIDVLANDTDAEDDPLSITAFDAASVQGGTVSCVGTCSYTPPAAFSR